MKSKNITAVIATIGRSTIFDAIESAKREFENVIVVADSIELPLNLPEGPLYLKTGQKFGSNSYGAAAWNMGAYAASTKYVAHLGDDDEYVEGAGDFMENKVNEFPNIDIWVPAIKYKDGHVDCKNPGMWHGNIGSPTFKTILFYELPICNAIKNEFDAEGRHIDFCHARELVNMGFLIEWYGEVLNLVRPKIDGDTGMGI